MPDWKRFFNILDQIQQVQIAKPYKTIRKDGESEENALSGFRPGYSDSALPREVNKPSIRLHLTQPIPEDEEPLLPHTNHQGSEKSEGKRESLYGRELKRHAAELYYGAYAEAIRGDFEVEYPTRSSLAASGFVEAPWGQARAAPLQKENGGHDRPRQATEEGRSRGKETMLNHDTHPVNMTKEIAWEQIPDK